MWLQRCRVTAQLATSRPTDYPLWSKARVGHYKSDPILQVRSLSPTPGYQQQPHWKNGGKSKTRMGHYKSDPILQVRSLSPYSWMVLDAAQKAKAAATALKKVVTVNGVNKRHNSRNWAQALPIYATKQTPIGSYKKWWIITFWFCSSKLFCVLWLRV